jgi:hypothetical protein
MTFSANILFSACRCTASSRDCTRSAATRLESRSTAAAMARLTIEFMRVEQMLAV